MTNIRFRYHSLALAMTAYLLNVIDLICTRIALSGGATELNPLMRDAALRSGYKLMTVGMLFLLLAAIPRRSARLGLILCTAVYAAVDMYHFIFLTGGTI